MEAERATDPRGASVLLPRRDDHPHPTSEALLRPAVCFGCPRIRVSPLSTTDVSYLWVRQFTPRLAADHNNPPLGPLRWEVFDPSGRWLGGVQTPEGLEVRNVRGGLVLGVLAGEFGAEEVRIYRIEGQDD